MYVEKTVYFSLNIYYLIIAQIKKMFFYKFLRFDSLMERKKLNIYSSVRLKNEFFYVGFQYTTKSVVISTGCRPHPPFLYV
jgi:hypothetical protein